MAFEPGKCRCYASLVFRFLRTKALCAATLLGHGVLAAEGDTPAADKQTSGYLDVGGSKIYYETRGSGPAIILLHDGLLHAVTWDEVWQPLATKHEVIRYDRCGYGRSELPTRSYSPTEDVSKLLTHLKVQHAVIVGSSSGGALAIDFAIPAAILQSLAGQYKSGDTILSLAVEGNHLVGQIGGVGNYFFYPESQSKFYSRLEETDVEFQQDASGKVSGLVMYQAGTSNYWQRI